MQVLSVLEVLRPIDEELGDLHCIEGSALQQLVANHPHIQGVIQGGIAADAADIDIFFTGDVGWHWPAICRWIGKHTHARSTL